jgi:hypothetical protein
MFNVNALITKIKSRTMVPWHSQILRAVDSNALLIADIS